MRATVNIVSRSNRRWVIEWVAILVFLFVVPLLLVGSYYGLKNEEDFDRALSRSGETPASPRLAWSIRIGGASLFRPDISIRSTHFGLNVDDSESEIRSRRVWEGSLSGSYRATYLAKFHGSMFPTVTTVFRDVSPDGNVTFHAHTNGLRPVRTYFLAVMLFSCLGAAFLKLVELAERKIAGARNLGAPTED